jgi:hypothetical protein
MVYNTCWCQGDKDFCHYFKGSALFETEKTTFHPLLLQDITSECKRNKYALHLHIHDLLICNEHIIARTLLVILNHRDMYHILLG